MSLHNLVFCAGASSKVRQEHRGMFLLLNKTFHALFMLMYMICTHTSSLGSFCSFWHVLLCSVHMPQQLLFVLSCLLSNLSLKQWVFLVSNIGLVVSWPENGTSEQGKESLLYLPLLFFCCVSSFIKTLTCPQQRFTKQTKDNCCLCWYSSSKKFILYNDQYTCSMTKW